MKDTDTIRPDLLTALLDSVRGRAVARSDRGTLTLCVAYREVIAQRDKARAELDRLRTGSDGRIHWVGCWVEQGHHPCAVAEVERCQRAHGIAELTLTDAEAEVARYEDAAQSVALLLDWASGDTPTAADVEGLAAHARLLQIQAERAADKAAKGGEE